MPARGAALSKKQTEIGIRENVINELNEDEKLKVKRTKVGRSLIWALCLTLLGLRHAPGARTFAEALRRRTSPHEPPM